MDKVVIKRDGRVVPFDRDRIASAIFKAARSVQGRDRKTAERLAGMVEWMVDEKFYSKGRVPSVEDIQDIVEKVLIEEGHAKVAKAYILYRQKRAEARELESIFVDGIKLVDEYVERSDWRVAENSNMTYSLQGLNFYLASSVVARYWLNKIYPPEIKKAHESGDFHIHDLGILGVYCVGWDLEDLLRVGFGGVRGKIESKPAKHFRVALGQIVNFFYTLQGEAAGAQAFSNFDTLLAPFIRYDGLGYREVKQAIQEFLFNVNVPTRVGFQSLDYDMPVVVRKNGRVMVEKIGRLVDGQFSANGDRVIKNVDGYGNPSEDSLAVKPPESFEALGFDENGNVKWLKVKAFVKHKVPHRHFKKVSTTSGEARVSPAHSLFHLNDHEVKPISASQLEVSERDALTMNSHVLAIRSINDGILGSRTSLDISELGWKGDATVLENDELEAFVRLAAWVTVVGKPHDDGIRLHVRHDSAALESDLKRLNVSYRVDGDSYIVYGGLADVLAQFVDVDDAERAVPYFIFDLNSDLRKAYLDTIFKAAGGRVSSPSEILLTGLSLIAVSLGLNVNVDGNTLSIAENGEDAPEFARNDLLGSAVTGITDYEYGHDWEYDISVDAPTENFAGGAGLLLFHNTPFTNITLDLTVSPLYKGKHVIIGGKEMPETYDEFQEEMDMINRAFAEVMMEGDAKSRIFTFPIPTYNITKDFDWSNDKLQPLWEMTAKFGVPYFANFVHSDMRPEDARSMCCRLRLDNRELRKRGGGLFGAAPLTGSIGVVTINLPRIGFEASNEDEFFKILEDRMFLAHKSLEIKRKVLEDLTERGLYPYSKFYLRSIKEAVGRYWNNHFSTIGLVGMNEMTRNFLGVPIIHPEAREFALKVLKFMREKIADFQAETGNLYNLEATPAEGASYRLAKKDLENYPGIKTAGTVTSPYYTNSVHVPVDYTNDIFEILEHQDELQIQFTGGTVVHLFIGEAIHDWRVVRDLVRQIVSNYRLPYFSLTPTFSVCPIHGYIPGEHWICPYPHSEEDLKRFGRVMELDIEELQQLQEGAYLIVEDEEEEEQKDEAPFGGLILKLDNL